MVYALLVFNDVEPKYQSARQAKENLDAYLVVLSKYPEQVNETAIVKSNEGGRFRYSGGRLQEDTKGAPKDSLKSIVFLECDTFNEALALASQFKMVENSIVELRPAMILNRTTEALQGD
jgi:hypothetical protein